MPLFAGMPSAEHWRSILVCGQATLRDAIIGLVAFSAVAASARDRAWVLSPTADQYADAQSRVAEAEVHLFHFYVHEGLRAAGLSGRELRHTRKSVRAQLLPVAELLTRFPS